MTHADGKRVLVVLSDPPLPFGNAAARWYYLFLRGLRDAGCRATAFVPSNDDGDTERVRELFPNGAFDVRCFPHMRRFGLRSKWETWKRPHSYNFGAEFRRDLAAEMARGYDVLHCEQLWGGWMALADPARALINVHYSFAVDCAGEKPGSFATRLLQIRTTQAERQLLRRMRTICTLTDELTKRVRQINPKATVHTVPFGLDTSLYPFRTKIPDGGPPVIGMIGTFGWRPTYLAAQRLLCDLWPSIRAQFPDARLLLVGRNARSAMEPLHPGPEVELHEDVPDIIPYFRELDVLVYPASLGSGMKVKVLEAFAFGTPVVTTRAGVEGIPARDGVHAAIGSSDKELIAATVSLIRDRDAAVRQAVAARHLLEDWCSPQRTVSQYLTIYDSIGNEQ